MAYCEDAPCCGCCGRSLYGSEEGVGYEREYDDDPYYDEDEWFEEECDECGEDADDCECDEYPLPVFREDLGWDGGMEA